MGKPTGSPTFGPLWKGMNTTPLPDDAPLVNTPNRASADLLRQARKQVRDKSDRGHALSQLRLATQRKVATVVPSPAPTPAAPATSSGFGGGGYSGRNASALGNLSNSGFTTSKPPAPNPNLP